MGSSGFTLREQVKDWREFSQPHSLLGWWLHAEQLESVQTGTEINIFKETWLCKKKKKYVGALQAAI